ncbi:ATP-dependent DNA helicase, Rep family [Yoonia tamlensis]|uniref:DNA 3'-5' helicase n=1 Tax=Yoonia tamlensis TaxID=390270 RepID=A0A1I6G0V5_9RHOB|nr:UvrD-helicase domain-containing protein [Yoonia tamlensis]SFR35819.1 ATP-dependent DNA helicase, Rep family [Yoonia tamlensis]
MNDFSEEDAFEAAVPLSQRAMARPAMPDFDLSGLNAAQREAVETVNGPVLMLAGAGTGKTKALTTRIAYLLAKGHAQPHEILAVTFTNKAAREMKNRIGGLIGDAQEGMRWLGTFHSVCVKQLRRHAELVGLKSGFTILDTDDQIRLMKQLIDAAGIDAKRWPPRMLSGIIDAWKNKAWTPDKVPASDSAAFDSQAVPLYIAYQRRLLELNAVDFGDILLHMVTIFQTHPDILQQYQRWFRYILVDEYQDTNVAQYLWLRLLAQGHKNICCVGDDDQSIYGWRGAEVGNILRFESDFPGAHVVRLEENYRSTPHILAAASGVIAGNRDRLGKTLFTAREDGEKVRLTGYWDGDEEARSIGDDIESMQRGTRGMDPIGLDSMAILVRASHQMRAFEDRFLSIGLPYRVIGGPRFYERMEIRDAMAYFRLAVSHDDDLAFERVVNTPKRGLGEKAVQMIQRTARDNNLSLVEGARIVCQNRLLGGKGLKELTKFVADLDRWHDAVYPDSTPMIDDDAVLDDGFATPVTTYDHIALAEMILDESGYTGYWQNDKTPEAPGRLENLKELVKALENFENLQGFLEHVSLIMENETEEQGEKVSIMTLHAAKGLEFPVVFLPGWEEGLFPSQRSMDESGLKGLEEERRLAYVGITRAEEICAISFASNRRVYGQWQSQLPSRFVDELPPAHVDVLTPSGLSSGAGMVASELHDRAHSADVYNSPGWKRLQSRGQTPNAPRAQSITINATAECAFVAGDRVFHQKFGYGNVDGIEGDKLLISFDKAGIKHVVARFVVSADAADDVPF